MEIKATMKRRPLSSEYDDRSSMVKRPRQNTPITLEKLPTEILEQIFFATLNGNLLKASSRIAVKLSGSQIIYRASFFIAFYHHKLLELRKEYRFEHLLPELGLPVPFWELRSMVRAVLDSRWCRWTWVKSLLSGRLQQAVITFGRIHASEESSRVKEATEDPQNYTKIEKFLKTTYSSKGFRYTDSDDGFSKTRSSKTPLEIREIVDFLETASSSDLHLSHSFNCGTKILGARFSLHTNLFDMAISSINHDTNRYVSKVTEHWRLQLHPFGDIPLETRWLDEFYIDNTPFRDLIHRPFAFCGLTGRQNPQDTWKDMQERLNDVIAIGDVIKLRHLLQLDYFMRPQTVPYHVPTEFFRKAAIKDCKRLDKGNPRDVETILRDLVHVLFSIDPQSLPRYETTVEIHQWALHAQARVRTYFRDRYHACSGIKEFLDGGHEFWGQTKRSTRDRFRLQDYIQKMDIEILRFLCTGELARTPNRTSPDLATPVLWGVNEEADDRELVAGLYREHVSDTEMTSEELEALVGGIVPPLRYPIGPGYIKILN